MATTELCTVCSKPAVYPDMLTDCRECDEPCHTDEPCAADYDVDMPFDGSPIASLLCRNCRRKRLVVRYLKAPGPHAPELTWPTVAGWFWARCESIGAMPGEWHGPFTSETEALYCAETGLYRCASPDCPGMPYPASVIAHLSRCGYSKEDRR